MKKGQAAIEYLTTYGWAIIVLLLMVSALSLFGVIRPRDWAPERCEMGAEFACSEHVFTNDGSEVTMLLLIKNNLRERVIIDYINCTFEGVGQGINENDISIGAAEEKEISCSTTEQSIRDMRGKIRASFEIEYMKRDGLFPHTIKGTAFGQVNTP